MAEQREPGWFWVKRRSDGREVIACRDGDGYWLMPGLTGDVWRETGPEEFAPFTEILSAAPSQQQMPTFDGVKTQVIRELSPLREALASYKSPASQPQQQDTAGLVEQVDTAGLNPAASVRAGSSPAAGTTIKDRMYAAIQDAAARAGPGQLVPLTGEIVALIEETVRPSAASQSQQQDLVAASVLHAEPGQPSNPAEAMAWATEAYQNARKMVADNPGLYDPGDADLIANAAALIAYATREREAVCDEITAIVEKWSPHNERWGDMPYDAVDVQSIILGNINRIRARSAQSKEGK